MGTSTLESAERAGQIAELSLKRMREQLGFACDTQDAPLTMALTDSYLQRTHERKPLIEALAFATAKIQGDPHLPRLGSTHFEEYTHSHLPGHLRDDFLRSWTHYVAFCRRRRERFDCVQIYEAALL